MSNDQAMAATGSAGRRGSPSRTRRAVLLPWHLVLFAVFIVAYLSGTDASLVRIHLYAGCVLVSLLALRLAIGLASPAGGALALRLPNFIPWRAAARNRHPVLAWITALLLVAVPVAAATGWNAGATQAAADLHSELSNLAVGLVAVHATVVIAIFAA